MSTGAENSQIEHRFSSLFLGFEPGHESLLISPDSVVLEIPGFAVGMTLFERGPVEIGRIVGGNVSIAGHELFVGFILRRGGRADGMAEDATAGDVNEVYELAANNEGENLISDLSRQLQQWGRGCVALNALIVVSLRPFCSVG